MSDLAVIDKEVEELEAELLTLKKRISETRKKRPREEVQDYVLKTADGQPVKLSELFGEKEDLIVIHNMGKGCVYCTLWADGFTGFTPHLSDRAGFVLTSPNPPDVLKKFGESRGWNFPLVSAEGTSFIQDMGFWQTHGEYTGPGPGVSSFHKDPDGKIYRIGKANFGPGDDFCSVWPLVDLLEGSKDWEPQYSYK
jgi:predicted dithiol-disulfide oxidoreductase (DUF899 family)